MPILIKRYANRKLYNTESSRYITLKGISELVREGRDIRVVDNESGDDITPIILSQILVDDQKQARDQDPVSGRVLSELIQRGGDALYGILRRSVGDVSENLSDARDGLNRLMSSDLAEKMDPRELSKAVHDSVERVMSVMDLPTRADLEALNKNLERLSTALEAFETRLKD